MDPRLRTGPFYNSPQEELRKAAERLVMLVLLSKSSQSPYSSELEVYVDILEVMKKFSSDYQFYEIKGTHHVHLNNPERLEDIIDDLVNKYYANETIFINLKQDNKLL